MCCVVTTWKNAWNRLDKLGVTGIEPLSPVKEPAEHSGFFFLAHASGAFSGARAWRRDDHGGAARQRPAVADHRNAPVKALGYLRIMFPVDDIDGTLARLRKRGAQPVGDV